MRWFEWIATAGGIGRFPGAPGTAASVVTTAIYMTAGGPWWLWLVLAVLLTGLGIAAAAPMERRHGRDPRIFVLDEVVGTLVALLGVAPHSWRCLMGLVLFRAFDILKPPPIRTFERWPGGWGIMADDVVAGLFAWAIVQGVGLVR